MWGDILGAGISALGNIFGGMMSQQGQRDANQQNIQLAREQMQFQERMSNTAYQRAMTDMKAAGLNPILAYQKGGASTPGGSMPNMQNEMGGWGPAMAGAVNSAQSAFKTAADYDVAKEEVPKKQAETSRTNMETKATEALIDKTKQETVTSARAADNLEAQTKVNNQDAINRGVQNAILVHDVGSAAAMSRIRTREAEDAERWGSGQWGQRGSTIERILDRVFKAGAGNVPTPPAPTAKQSAVTVYPSMGARMRWHSGQR